jgi:hypothetical protein
MNDEWLSNNATTNAQPLKLHRFRRTNQLMLARMKRQHTTGRFVPGIIMPLSDYKAAQDDPIAWARLMYYAEMYKQPEWCWCRTRECQRG